MSWNEIVITNSDVGNMSATALMNKFSNLYIAAGIPDGVEVYHGQNSNGGHVFCFSPKASEISQGVLASLSSQVLTETPNLTTFKKIRL